MTWMINFKYNVNTKDKLYPIVELIDEYKKILREDFDKNTLDEVKRMIKEEMTPEKILEVYGLTKESIESIKPQNSRHVSIYEDDRLDRHRVREMYKHIMRYF